MNKLIFIMAVLVLTSCTTTTKTHVIHGVSGIEIDCSGLSSGWEKCYKRAARECKATGYKVVTKSSDVKEEAGDYLFGWNPAGYLSRKMLVVCR